MSILFCTPAYGGQVTLGYFNSCLLLQENLIKNNVDYSWLTTGNESLITRARNTSAQGFLKSDFESLMFIDADIQFQPEDVIKLWNLDADVAVGAYPMKRDDMPLSAWKDGKIVQYGKEPVSVDYAGTGFMMIKRRVFETLKAESEPHTEKGELCWNFFDTAVHDGIYLSEDYNFCRKWTKHGEIILDPSIYLAHWGNHCFKRTTT